jgi:type I restriction enzyme S subunit
MSEVVLKEIPDNWVMGKVQDLITIRNGYAFKGKDFQDEVGAPVIRQTNLSTDVVNFKKPKYLPLSFLDEHPGYRVVKGDVLIGLSGSIGNLSRYVEDQPALQNQRTGLLLEQVPGATKFVQYYLQLIKKDLLDAAKGVAVQNISSKAIENWAMPIAPPEQQKRIVAKIEELFSHIDAGIAALVKAKQLLKQYRQSVLKAAVTGELTKQWREDNKDKLEPASQLLERILKERRQKWEEAERVKLERNGKFDPDSNWKDRYAEPVEPMIGTIEGLPDTWGAYTLDTFTAFTVDYRGKTPPTADEGIQVISAANVKKGGIIVKKPKLISQETYDKWSTRGLPESGDLILTTEAPVGEVALYPEEGVYQLTRRVFACKLVCVEPRFVLNWFLSKNFQDYLKPFIRGTTVPRILKPDLMAAPVPVVPKEEQLKIIEILDNKLQVISRAEESIGFQLAKALKNKQSVLAAAFSGDLVEPMVGDSSAKELLAKIAEEAKKNSEKPKIKIVKKKVNKRMTKRSLVSVLEENEKGLSPEKLMQESGFLVDEVDEFYQELSALFDRLEEMGLKDVDKNNWPYDAVVNLKLKDR